MRTDSDDGLRCDKHHQPHHDDGAHDDEQAHHDHAADHHDHVADTGHLSERRRCHFPAGC
jgi:hypothetical protein